MTNLPIPKLITPTDVRRQAEDLSVKTFDEWELSKYTLHRHEPTIHKRWFEKPKTQCVQMLLSAWPRMAASHRPDFAAFKRESERDLDNGTRFRDCYMWPYINLEDLSKPKTLLLFLQARARDRPDMFAIADSNTAHLGYVSKATVPAFLNQHTMMSTNR